LIATCEALGYNPPVLPQRFFRSRIWIVLLLWLGMALRLVPLVGNPLHQDEALYGFWGRLISSGRDPWLATVPVDKPPLGLYLIAGSQLVFGVSEFAIRLPGLAASLLSIPLTFVLARRLYGHFCGLVAAAVMTLTPFALLFGAAAFMDPILVAWWLAACYAALRGRWGWAGLMLGLAFAVKQQAVVLGGMVLGIGYWGLGIGKWQRQSPKQSGVEVASARFGVGLGGVVAGVVGWDRIRIVNGAAVGFWGQGVDSYGGLRLIWPAELVPRLRGWGRLGGYVFGWPWLALLLIMGVGLLLVHDLTRQRRTRPALTDLVLIAFVLFYSFFHLLIAFPVWDRYLLPMTPLLGLLLGRVASGNGSPRSRAEWEWRVASGEWRVASEVLRFTFYVLLAFSLVGGGVMAARGRIPVGGDHGAYDGLEEVVDYLRALPVGTVLYDRWLSWHYDFYLFDAYLYRAGFPSPGWLAADAAALYDGRPRYLVLPDWESPARLERALAEVGLTTSPVLTAHRRDGTVSFVVWEIGE
jgi:4-amino-4-deoxy-L-arabinose transferase-like glycosyltransferase